MDDAKALVQRIVIENHFDGLVLCAIGGKDNAARAAGSTSRGTGGKGKGATKGAKGGREAGAGGGAGRPAPTTFEHKDDDEGERYALTRIVQC